MVFGRFSCDAVTKIFILALIFMRASIGHSFNLRDPSTIIVKEQQARPIIYTFYENETHGNVHYDEDSKHVEMLDAWSKAWRERGWEPIILHLDDAKHHPDFQYYNEKFMSLNPGKSNMFDASHMFLMRWLAVAAQGVDAWMSDYETYPLHIRAFDGLPNYGKFTTYERFVPSLMSGSASEWERMAIAVTDQVLQILQQIGTEVVYTEEDALEDVWLSTSSGNKAFIAELRVDSYPYLEMHKIDCRRSADVLALHLTQSFTRDARDKNLIPKEISDSSRHMYGNIIVDHWIKQCSKNREK